MIFKLTAHDVIAQRIEDNNAAEAARVLRAENQRRHDRAMAGRTDAEVTRARVAQRASLR